VIDLASRRVRVVRVLVEVSGQITVKPFPKSQAGRRTVPVPAALADMLAEHRQTYSSPDLVSTNSVGGPVGRTSFLTRGRATPTFTVGSRKESGPAGHLPGH
jgi:hypothetical protein